MTTYLRRDPVRPVTKKVKAKEQKLAKQIYALQEAEYEKARMDAMQYGTGILLLSPDGALKHASIEEVINGLGTGKETVI